MNVSFYKQKILLWLVGCTVVLRVLADAPFQLAIASTGSVGMLALAGVSNGFCQVESTTQLGIGRGAYPKTGAVVAITSTQMALNLPVLDQQRFFRAVYLGTNPLTVSQPVSISTTSRFQRTGNSIDPMTGVVTGNNVANTWNVELPAWWAGQGLRPLGGTNMIVGINRKGVWFGTPNVLGQGALYASTDQGLTWTYAATLPKKYASDYIVRLATIPAGTNELIFASMNQGGLYLSTNQGVTFSTNLLPSWYVALTPRMPFHNNLLVEAVAGRTADDCHVLICFYGQRLEGGTYKIGCLYVFRTDLTLRQMAAGGTPQLQVAWKQDYFDFFARHVAGAIAVTNHAGVVSATANTLTDAAGIFRANDTTRPRCIRITSGTGAGQGRMIVSNTTNTLTIYTPWQILPDATSDYQIINGAQAGRGGMHLHCATWQPLAQNGETNILFISFGDNAAGHICRVANFDQLGVNPAGEDYSGWGWNYSDSQVFALAQQPTTMVANTNGTLVLLARDADASVLVSGDNSFRPKVAFEDTFNPYASAYAGVGYDAVVGSNQVAVVANLTEGAMGQYGIYAGDPTARQQMFRLVRGLNPVTSTNYVGYYAAYDNPQSGDVIVSGDSVGKGQITNTWLLRLPVLTNLQFSLVANATTNLIANADFQTNNGSLPSNWYSSYQIPAGRRVYNAADVYGGGCAWQVTQTNLNTNSQYAISSWLTGFSTDRPLCISFPYRISGAFNANYSSPAQLRVQWNSSTGTIRLDTIKGNNVWTTNQWHTDHFSVLPPTNAIKANFSYQFRNYTGSVDVALPSANWWRYAAPAVGARAADVLEHATADGDWSGKLNSHVEFLVLPLWPTDVNPYAMETVCSLLASDGSRCLLTWDYNLGFQAVLQDAQGKPLLSLNLGQLHTLTRFDPCRFVVDFQHGVLTAKLDAGGDVLQAVGATDAINSFSPVKIRLGSDQFTRANLGWEGYYSLLSCKGS